MKTTLFLCFCLDRNRIDDLRKSGLGKSKATETHSMIIEGGNDALRLDINVDRYGKPVKVRDQRHRNSFSMSHRNGS